MIVHIIGSLPDRNSDDANKAEVASAAFRGACRAIGAELAKRGYQVAIGSLAPNTVDRYVVEGMKSVPGKHSVSLYSRSKPAVVDESEFPKDKFEITPRYEQGDRRIAAMLDSDASLLIGGKTATVATGMIALRAKHAILAVPSFGGTSEVVWDAVVAHYGRSLPIEAIRTIGGEWVEGNEKVVADSLARIVVVNPLKDKIDLPQWYLTGTSVVCLIGWVLIFGSFGSTGSEAANATDTAAPTPHDEINYLMFFLIIGLASVIGTITRTWVNVYFSVKTTFSPKALIGDFILGITMGFIFFLFMYAGGTLVSGDEFKITASDFQRLAVIMSLVTISASFLLETAVDRFQERIVSYLDIDRSS